MDDEILDQEPQCIFFLVDPKNMDKIKELYPLSVECDYEREGRKCLHVTLTYHELLSLPQEYDIIVSCFHVALPEQNFTNLPLSDTVITDFGEPL
jgi:hypothetical protein